VIDMKRNAIIAILVLLIVSAVSAVVTIRAVNASRGGEVFNGAGGRIHGMIYGFNVYDELIPISWASVTAIRDGQTVDKAYSSDGFYEMFVPSGDFELVVEAPGYFSETKSLFVGDGSDYALDFYMERNNQPIPEFPTLAVQVIAVVSLISTLLLIRKRKFVIT
jgi:hypothetical protein